MKTKNFAILLLRKIISQVELVLKISQTTLFSEDFLFRDLYSQQFIP